jgi:hypothetical protein
MKNWLFFFFLLFSASSARAHLLHQRAVEEIWREENLPPFDELILSWNAKRPSEGKYLFYISIKTEDWSPWLFYASWGSEGQSSFLSTTEKDPVRSYQDAIEVMQGKKGTGFQIKVLAEGAASLKDMFALHAYTNGDKTADALPAISSATPIALSVKGLSQMALDHVRRADLCSPTSTTAVVRHLANHSNLDPILFAKQAWDGGFDIFGNWVFNVAAAASELGSCWNSWVERLNGFDDIYRQLLQGTPVVVSVKGPLKGSALPYAKGHLMVVTGFDPKEQKVVCMDPAFPQDRQTTVFYDLSDFVQAWNRRGRVAYMFHKNEGKVYEF